jgi:hypothetical protein
VWLRGRRTPADLAISWYSPLRQGSNRKEVGMSNISIEMNREIIDVPTRGSHVPDPGWSHTDSHGHVHRFAARELPTLEWVVTGIYWCDECRDEHEEGEWRCRICGDVVEPHYNFTGPEMLHIPGLVDYTLRIDGRSYWLTAEEASSLQGLEREALIARVTEIAATKDASATREP